MNLLHTTIIILGIATSCQHPEKNIATVTAPPLDSLFIVDRIPTGNPLSDSLTSLYIRKADKFAPYPILSPSLDSSYKAFQTGYYQLGKDTYGKIIHFEPDQNDYSSVQLFIENDAGDCVAAIELAYSYWEEGINGVGSSYIIRKDGNLRIFTKKYWIVYEYYMPDEREDTDWVLDTLMAHEIHRQSKVPIPMDSSRKARVEKMFEEQ